MEIAKKSFESPAVQLGLMILVGIGTTGEIIAGGSLSCEEVQGSTETDAADRMIRQPCAVERFTAGHLRRLSG
ncbi:hypothetical protein [Curtanaerobium respiraculi]|uniref:hypothetical protein n=1 Tax=Curtanaerobium respiraculi TaxID=2949669 RepID=UPI0024B37168|nr:hypothetical protein [Curtanaerobium respiraculi]